MTILDFLTQLQANNNKAWMDLNRDTYKQVREALLNLTETVLLKMRAIDPSIGLLKPTDCIFRINRDIRFSKVKTPYKTNMGLYIARGGKSMSYAGYYLHLEPNNKSFIAGGVYQPEAAVLKSIRQEIDYNGRDLDAILSHTAFRKFFGGTLKGESLQRMPKSYDEYHPYKEWLKLKSFLAIHPLKDTAVEQANLQDKVLKGFTTLCPLIQFLNHAIPTDSQ